MIRQLHSNPFCRRFASDLHCSVWLSRSAKNVWTRSKILISFVKCHYMILCFLSYNINKQTKKNFNYSEFIEKDNTILLVPCKVHPVEHWNLNIIITVMIISKSYKLQYIEVNVKKNIIKFLWISAFVGSLHTVTYNNFILQSQYIRHVDPSVSPEIQ